MSHFDGLPQDVAGVLLVGAEGCAETSDETWLRDATDQEQAGFEDFCRQLVRNRDGDKAATEFRLGDVAVDGIGRPYWLKAVLNGPETPSIALDKARKYTRCLRVHCDW